MSDEKLTPSGQDWQAARDRVLAQYPDARWHRGRMGIYSSALLKEQETGDFSPVLFDTEPAAWLDADRKLQSPSVPASTEGEEAAMSAEPQQIDWTDDEAVCRSANPTIPARVVGYTRNWKEIRRVLPEIQAFEREHNPSYANRLTTAKQDAPVSDIDRCIAIVREYASEAQDARIAAADERGQFGYSNRVAAAEIIKGRLQGLKG